MIFPLSIYAPVTILLAFIDKKRIDAIRNRNLPNIDHGVSKALAGITAGTLFAFFWNNPGGDVVFMFKWMLIDMAVFAVGCVGIRLLIFDPVLNIFRFGWKGIKYQSTKSSSETEIFENKHPFWTWEKQRLAGILLISIALLTEYLLKK